MKSRALTAVLLAAGLLAAGAATAQQPAPPNPLDVIPDKMPFDIPVGTKIRLERAQSLVQAAVAEAKRRGWEMNVAVVDPMGNLIAFARMDDAQVASVAVSEHKARTAARYRRPTRVFEDAVQKASLRYMLTLDDVIASRGGIPLVEGGKLIGAVGCSGGTGSQDEAVCTVAAALINK